MATGPERFDDDRLLQAVEKATQVYKFCPNRVWAMVESSAEKDQELHALFPPVDARLDKLFRHRQDQKAADNIHDRCTFDFCEHSLVDSTSVKQRHESRSCAVIACKPIAHADIFPAAILNSAARRQQPTAWHLYGRRTMRPHQKYMAISHVWSDGTGAGQGSGKVNKCLFDFFRDIAFKLQCDGIWWDTLCLPSEKTARALAIQRMHENYEYAEVTVVHDCFLRELPWTDAESACLAIAMSPWFSRGWTALELAKSRTVKVVFKGEKGYILKDLEDDILHNPRTARHVIASGIIHRLRTQSVRGIDDLLFVLRSRSTSWTKDMAVISALLVGVAIETDAEVLTEPEDRTAATESAKNVYQQEIFEKVVKHVGSVEYGHLFHTLPTMFEGASWCPARLLSMPPTFLDGNNTMSQANANSHPDRLPPLKVDSQGNVVGVWIVFPASCVCPGDCDWRDTHPLIAARMRSSLEKETSHRVLVEPFAESIVRFLVVKMLVAPFTSNAYQFIGSAHFKQAQLFDKSLGVRKEVSILHRPDKPPSEDTKAKVSVVRFSGEASRSQPPQTEDSDEDEGSEMPSHQSNDSLSVYESFDYSNYEDDFDLARPPKRHRETPLDQGFLLAVKEGRERDVLQFLSRGVDLSCHDEDLRTPMSWAAGGGYAKIVRMILNRHRDRIDAAERLSNFEDWKPKRPISYIDHISQRFLDQIDSQDKDGRTPLAWAAIHGHTDIVNQLILRHEIKIDSTERHLWTPLAFAVAGGHDSVVRLLLDAGASIDTIVSGKVSLLGLAVMAGSVSTAKLLLDSGARTEGPPGAELPLLIAAETGDRRFLKLLLNRGAKIDVADRSGTALYRAAARGHIAVVKLLLKEKDRFNINEIVPLAPYGNTALVAAVLGGEPWSPFSWNPLSSSTRVGTREDYEEIVRLLLESGVSDVNTEDIDNSTPLHVAASRGYDNVLKYLLDTGQVSVNAQTDKGMTPLYCAAVSGHENIVRMLLGAKASANIKSRPRGDYPGQTPMSAAREYGHDAIADLLKPATSISNRLFAPVEKFLTRGEVRERQKDGFFLS